jgi:hypothetical protein
MRRAISVALLGFLGSVAWADAPAGDAHAPAGDARAEMAAALVEQADLQPTPLSLPVTAAAPRHAAAASAVKRGIQPRVPVDAARAANQVTQRAEAQGAVAHQAQAAAAAAAGQAQAQAAKERASHPRR